MGGKALINKCFTRRYERQEFFDLVAKIENKLRLGFDGRFSLIPAVASKKDFGDADFIIELMPGENPKEILYNLFNPTAYVHNGGVHTIDIEELQCDFITHPPEHYDTTVSYFSYELGNFQGRVAHKLGVKLGHDGLTMPIRIGDNEIGVLEVTRNVSEYFRLLGFDYTRFLAGFDDLEQFYKYIISSKYFDADIFSFENLNHINRTRNRKRPIYSKFVKYLEDNKIEKNSNAPKIGALYMGEFLSQKGLLVQREEMIKKAFRQQKAREKLLAAAQSLGLQDKALGAAMKKFKDSLDNWMDFVDISSQDTISHYVQQLSQ